MKSRYYPFLDVVLDVFYSIILYNVFIAFPGLRLESLLMVFACLIMLNYWWDARSDTLFPKHYLFDFYAVSVIMFIFSQWPTHFLNLHYFLLITSTFFFADGIYAFIAIYAHKETVDETALKLDVAVELFLGAIYLLFAQIITALTVSTIIVIYVPYLIWFWTNIKRGYFKPKFLNSGNQPY
ncbi:MAG: hypothetical protein V1846_02785 [Candidatus Komeilibacteria bacterium]